MKRKLYLSGPMTGIPNWNRQSFDDAAKQLTDLGYEVINPFDLPEPVKPNPLNDSMEWAAYLARDVIGILNGMADTVVMLPGWYDSKGACLEEAVARMKSIPVVTLGQILQAHEKREPYSFPWPRKKEAANE